MQYCTVLCHLFISDMGLTMGEAQVIAQDRHRWRRDIVALCPTLG